MGLQQHHANSHIRMQRPLISWRQVSQHIPTKHNSVAKQAWQTWHAKPPHSWALLGVSILWGSQTCNAICSQQFKYPQ